MTLIEMKVFINAPSLVSSVDWLGSIMHFSNSVFFRCNCVAVKAQYCMCDTSFSSVPVLFLHSVNCIIAF